MTDKDNKAMDAKQKKEPANNKDKAKKASKKAFNWSALWIVIALIIASLGLAGAGYVWLQFDQYKQQSSRQLNNMMNELESTLKSKLQNKLEASDVSKQVTPLVSALKTHLEALEKRSQDAALARDSLTESTQKLFELYGRDKNGWQLAEVEYLLRIAQHRLVIENDFQGAEKTLKAADDKISEIADPGLLPVRVAISDERVLLQSRKRPDLVGIVLSLSRINKQIPLLNLTVNKKKEEVVQLGSGLNTNQVDANAPWQEQVTQFVKSLVKVEPLKKSLAIPSVNLIDAINTLEETLKLAKWAVLERDQRQYQQLMQQSSDLFKRYFDENNNYHSEINAELNRLLSLEIRPELPDISTSLELLKAIIVKKEHALVKQAEQAEQQSEPMDMTITNDNKNNDGLNDSVDGETNE